MSEIDQLIEAAAEKRPENGTGNIKIWDLPYPMKSIFTNKTSNLRINQGRRIRYRQDTNAVQNTKGFEG